MSIESPPRPDPDSVRDRSGRRLTTVLIALSGLLLLAGTFGVLDPVGLVWVERLLDHPFIFGVAAAALFGYGLALLPGRVWVGLLLAIPCLVVACGWAAFGLFWSSWAGLDEVATVSAPHGSGRDFEAVVEEGSDGIDPVWYVTIRQTGSPLARGWEAGCIDGDWVDFEHLEWNGRDELLVHTSDGPAYVEVNARTGRPYPVAGDYWRTCP